MLRAQRAGRLVALVALGALGALDRVPRALPLEQVLADGAVQVLVAGRGGHRRDPRMLESF